MRFALFAAVVGILAGWAGGGRLARFSLMLPRAPVLALGGLTLMLAAGRLDIPAALQIMAIGHVVLLWFVALNARRYTGIWLVGLGLGLNLAILMVNQGWPYRPSAVLAAGLRSRDSAQQGFRTTATSHPERKSDRLVLLADIIPVAPLREVVSFGDLFQCVGLGSVLCNAMQRRPTRRPMTADLGLDLRTGTPADPRAAGARLDLRQPEPVVELPNILSVAGDVGLGLDAGLDVGLGVGLGVGEEFWTERRRLLREDAWAAAIDKDPEVSHLLSDEMRRAAIDLASEGDA